MEIHGQFSSWSATLIAFVLALVLLFLVWFTFSLNLIPIRRMIKPQSWLSTSGLVILGALVIMLELRLVIGLLPPYMALNGYGISQTFEYRPTVSGKGFYFLVPYSVMLSAYFSKYLDLPPWGKAQKADIPT